MSWGRPYYLKFFGIWIRGSWGFDQRPLYAIKCWKMPKSELPSRVYENGTAALSTIKRRFYRINLPFFMQVVLWLKWSYFSLRRPPLCVQCLCIFSFGVKYDFIVVAGDCRLFSWFSYAILLIESDNVPEGVLHLRPSSKYLPWIPYCHEFPHCVSSL